MLSGNLTEIKFAWPEVSNAPDTISSTSESNVSNEYNYQEMQVIGETELSTNEVAYING